MKRRSPTRDAVLAALQSGPATRAELEAALGKQLQATMHDLLKRKMVHIHGWLRGTGNMRAFRMIYAAGDGADAPKPEPDRLGKYKRYYQNHKPVLKEKRKAAFPKYKDKVNASARRRRAKKKLATNPFIQLDIGTFKTLLRKAKKKAAKEVRAMVSA